MDNVSQPIRPWHGVHIPMKTNQDIDGLIRELPGFEKIGINVIVAEVNYNFAYVSHPELQEHNPIDYDDAHRLSRACRERCIRLIPQFQCLGHQSWAEKTFPLLLRYPEFDETPGKFPNNSGIYCRSWCPQHPDINTIIFAIFDELVDAFEADALHVGLDEVFLIASEHCQRCKGADPASLFSGSVSDYYDHLVVKRGVEMLMWGDRLLSDAETGYGEWEASRNNTQSSIDRIPKDIIVCDWHYELRDTYPSVPYFLNKGFRVLPGGWRDIKAAQALNNYAQQHRSERMLGYLCTTWGVVKPGEISNWLPVTTVFTV